MQSNVGLYLPGTYGSDFAFLSFWVAKLGAALSKGHIFQFSEENYTTALALKFSSYISNRKPITQGCADCAVGHCELPHSVKTKQGQGSPDLSLPLAHK